jgi:hypothetical protein
MIARIVLLAGVITFAGPIGAQEAPRLFLDREDRDASFIEPFVELPGDLLQKHPSLSRQVILFFRPDCPFSPGVHEDLRVWAETLPEGWTFKAIPAVQRGETGLATVHFAARLAVSKGWTRAYSETRYWDSLYSRAAAGEVNLRDVLDVAESAIDAGVDRSALRRALKETVIRDAALQGIELAFDHQLRRVPVISVGGRYATHPDLVGTDPTNLLRVVNALVSMRLEALPNPQITNPTTPEAP